jgi:hypothetical protein
VVAIAEASILNLQPAPGAPKTLDLARSGVFDF